MKEKKKNKMTAEDVIGPQPRTLWIVTATIGLLLIIAGTMMPLFQRGMIFSEMSPVFRYIYAGGALLLTVSRLMSPYRGSALRVKRLYRIELWSSFFFCVGAFFLFYEPSTSRDWLAFTLAGGAIQVYTSIMIPRAINKALEKEA